MYTAIATFMPAEHVYIVYLYIPLILYVVVFINIGA